MVIQITSAATSPLRGWTPQAALAPQLGQVLYFSGEQMKIENLLSAKYLIAYLYGVFVLNVISIFYMDRANNSLNDKVEFLATLVLPVFIALVAVTKSAELSARQTIFALVGLFVGGPVVFFAHVTLTL